MLCPSSLTFFLSGSALPVFLPFWLTFWLLFFLSHAPVPYLLYCHCHRSKMKIEHTNGEDNGISLPSIWAARCLPCRCRLLMVFDASGLTSRLKALNNLYKCRMFAKKLFRGSQNVYTVILKLVQHSPKMMLMKTLSKLIRMVSNRLWTNTEMILTWAQHAQDWLKSCLVLDIAEGFASNTR